MDVKTLAAPATVTSGLAYLSQVASWVNSLQDAGANLSADAQALTTAAGTNLLAVAPQAQDIVTFYNTLFNNSMGQPRDIAADAGSTLRALQDYVTRTDETLAVNAALIASLQAQLAAKPAAPIQHAPPAKPAQNPNVMTSTTFLVGVAAVLAIGGGVWWASRNAKTKAREVYAKNKTMVSEAAKLKQLGA